MKPLIHSGVLLCALMAANTCSASTVRPHLNSGACLSCHHQQRVTLTEGACISCHAGNMDFLGSHADTSADAGLWLLGAAGGSGALFLLALGVAGVRRTAPVGAAMAVAVLAAPATEFRGSPPWEGAQYVADGFACDLSPRLSPQGDALVFCRRGPDTSGDGCVDLRDGLALFLLRRGWNRPLRLTSYQLDVQGAMAAWSPDGSAFTVPLPAAGHGTAGLALFDAEGVRRGLLLSTGGEILSPMFSDTGERIAFVEGTGIGVWNVPDDRRTWALEPLEDRTFPRLCGWSPQGGGPLFTRGHAYGDLERGSDGRRCLPAEAPLEEATGGAAVHLTTPGATPMRRFRPQPVQGGVFYLARSPESAPGLYHFDGRTETRWSGATEVVHGFVARGPGDCWAWVAAGQGEELLKHFRGPLDAEVHPAVMSPHMLALAVPGDGEIRFAGAAQGDGHRGLFGVDGRTNTPLAGRDFYGVSSSGGSLAAVVVDSEPDSGGAAVPWDRAALWVEWSDP